MTGTDAGILAAAYLLGAVPFGLILTRAAGGGDLRRMGSGNIGATNVLRTQGKALALLTLLLDFGKAALSVYVGRRVGSAPFVGAAAGAAAVVGHCFPIYLRFKGGKGIASGLGTFLLVAPAATAAAFLVFLAEILTLRYVSLGSVLASLTFSVFLAVSHWASGWYDLPTVVLGGLTGLLLVSRHRANLQRLRKGTEPRLWGKGPGRGGRS